MSNWMARILSFHLLSFACTKESNPACRQAGKKSAANSLPAGRQGMNIL
jgi:hypothetical protein